MKNNLTILLLIVLLNFICKINANQKTVTVNAIIKSLAAKYCPMRGFNGESYCPNNGNLASEPFIISTEDFKKTKSGQSAMNNMSKQTSINNKFVKVEGIEYLVKEAAKFKKEALNLGPTYNKKSTPRSLSGFGFDRTNREMKYPVYPTQNPVASSHQEHRARDFTNVHAFISWVLTPHGKMEAGLYARDMGVLRNMANAFSDSTAKLGITQKLYRTHRTEISSSTPIPEFEQAVSMLPAYDKNDPNSVTRYRQIITFWGTDIALTVNHGGIVYQQTVIKKCFGGNIQEGMINDIESIINSRQPGSGYLRYRKLGILELRGGNPEISNIPQRIATFGTAPAPIEWDSVPLYTAVANDQRRAWLKSAIEDYIQDQRHTSINIINDVRNAELNHYKRRQNIYLATFNVEQGGRWLVRWTGCPYVHLRGAVYCPWCTLLQPITQLGAGQHLTSGGPYNTHVVVERDPNSGNGRIRMVEGGHNRYISPWIRTGCTWVQQYGRHHIDGVGWVDVSRILYRAFCIDCLPHIQQSAAQHGQTHTRLTCVCPTF